MPCAHSANNQQFNLDTCNDFGTAIKYQYAPNATFYCRPSSTDAGLGRFVVTTMALSGLGGTSSAAFVASFMMPYKAVVVLAGLNVSGNGGGGIQAVPGHAALHLAPPLHCTTSHHKLPPHDDDARTGHHAHMLLALPCFLPRPA